MEVSHERDQPASSRSGGWATALGEKETQGACVLPPGARGFLAAGLYSSASTWMFNLVAQILKAGGWRDLKTLYMDKLDDAAVDAIRNAPCFLAKSHIPGPALGPLLESCGLPVVMTVRDPRDAIASMMLRWNLGFDLAFGRVRTSAQALAKLAGYRPALLFRYEDGFMLDERCAETVARWLGVALSAADRRALLAELTPQAVEARIAAWQRSGVLGNGAPDVEYEPETHWHVGHIGDRLVGKWPGILTAAQAAQVVYATRPFSRSSMPPALFAKPSATRPAHRSSPVRCCRSPGQEPAPAIWAKGLSSPSSGESGPAPARRSPPSLSPRRSDGG